MARVLLALGSNVGDALGALQRSACELSKLLRNSQPSHIYRTAPMYVVDQPPFLNAAIAGETDLPPLALLRRVKELERKLGREERERFGPREIDIDLIAYGSLKFRSWEKGELLLEIPHPRVAERRFVLQPLADLAPHCVLPGLGAVEQLLKQTNEQAGDVVRLEDAVLFVQCEG